MDGLRKSISESPRATAGTGRGVRAAVGLLLLFLALAATAANLVDGVADPDPVGLGRQRVHDALGVVQETFVCNHVGKRLALDKLGHSPSFRTDFDRNSDKITSSKVGQNLLLKAGAEIEKYAWKRSVLEEFAADKCL